MSVSPSQTEHRASDGASPDSNSPAPARNDFGALWLLAGVVALTASFLWMIRDVWLSKPVVVADKPKAQIEQPTETVKLPEQTTRTVPKAAPVDAKQLDAARLTELQEQAQRMEQQRLEIEKRLEQERAANLALQQQRAAAEQQLLKERRERAALEQRRLAAEERLAQQKAQRAALERQARLEAQRLEQARQAALKAEQERARAEAEARAALVDDSSAPRAAADRGETIEAFPEQDISTADSQPAQAKESGFSTNPCDGPSAKFLSTCR